MNGGCVISKDRKRSYDRKFSENIYRLTVRNAFALLAVALFVISLFTRRGYALQSLAYLIGAAAYLAELSILSDGFKNRSELREYLMPILFFVLYIILCISHFL